MADLDTDKLPPTQYLILEVLAARQWLGEGYWTFPARVAAALRDLQALDLIMVTHGNTENTLRASLTDLGREHALHAGYVSPVVAQAEARGYQRAIDELLAVPSHESHVAADWLEAQRDGRKPTFVTTRWQSVAALQQAHDHAVADLERSDRTLLITAGQVRQLQDELAEVRVRLDTATAQRDEARENVNRLREAANILLDRHTWGDQMGVHAAIPRLRKAMEAGT